MSDFSNDDLKINKTLKVDDRVSEPEINLVGSLDLSNKPAGSYYYNAENNYNYTKNWFNYNRLDSVNNEVVINEVVQYSKPELTPGILDTSKTYSLSSTSMNAIWAARIETGSNGDTSGYSGVDAVGNTYLLVNYTFPNNATVYNADDTIAFTKLNNGPGSTSTCLAKFNAAGTALWAIRIIRSIPGDSTVSQFCITDNQGTTYIVGTGGSDVIFEDAAGNPVYTVNMPGKDYLVAYDSNGTPDWVTYFTEGFRGSLWVDNQPIGNVYLITSNGFAPTIFYDSVPAAPTPVLAAGRTIAFGTDQIVKVERSAGGDATVWLNTLAANLNLFSGMSIALLGLINDGGSFNTFDPVVITVTDYAGYSTITYSNPTGSMPYALSNTEGSPVITVTGGALAKFRSSSGLFQWAATAEGFRVGGFLNFVNYSNQGITTDLYGNVYTTGYYTYFSLISNAATSEQPVFKDSGKTLPPYSSPIIWNPVEDNRNWTGIAINDNGNIIVATVGNGYIYVSTDAGSSWNQRATIQNWSSVYCNDTGLIMVATIMDSVIYRSIDGGLNWIITNGEGSNARNWVAIAGNFSGSNLVALDEGGIIYYSTNFGLFWSASSGAPSANWIDVAYDSSTSFGPNGSFTAIIDGGGAYTSVDGGATWRNNSPIIAGYGIASDGTILVEVGQGTVDTIAVSYTSGLSWVGKGNTIFTTQGRGVVWNNTLSLWIAVGSGTNTIAYSNNGITWTGIGTSIFSNTGYGVACNGSNECIAVGSGTNTIAYSNNGITWTGIGTSIFSIAGYGVVYDIFSPLWVAVGSGTNTIAYSNNGITWTGIGTSIFSIAGYGVACNGSLWVAVGSGTNTIAYSNDGITWTGVGIIFSIRGNGIAYNGSRWVAVGEGTNTVFYSDDGISWSSATGTLFSVAGYSVNWVSSSSIWVAVGTGTYTLIQSVDGANWTTNDIIAPAPSTNLSAITGTNGSPDYRYLVTEKNGKIYGINTTGNWNVLDNTNRNYNDIAASSNLFYATVYNGAIYQSAYTFETSWTPTTIPRFWNRVAVSSSFADPIRSTAVATIPGGQIYIAKESDPVVNAVVIKYNPEGQVQWVTYIDTKDPEGNSGGIVLTSQSNGNIILGGIGNRFDMYNSTNYTTPIKSVNNQDATKFIACYSNDGIPLWVNTIGTSAGYSLNALSVDTLDNIYCIFGSQPLELYQPTNQLIYSQNTSNLSGVLIKYYPNGFVQSSTRMVKEGELFGTSIRVLNQGDIYLSGWAPVGGLTNFYDSPGNTGGITRTLGASSAYVCKYSSNTSSSFPIPEPEYNTVFDTQLRIGGSTRKIEGGYIGDGSIELWGGQTGLLPSDINIADANAGVISYLGHQPGYTIPTVDGLQEFNPNVYRFLTVGLSEPTFPINDPQPVSPGTIPYGYLPFYIQCPNYTTGLVFNNMLDNSSNLVLSTTGVISASGLEVSGLFSGDIIRILIHNGFQSEYVSLTVKGIIVSDIIYGFQTGIMFEENTRYLASIFGTTQQATATLISNGTERYLPAFYLPSLVKKGTLKLILQLYPKPT